MFMIAGFVHAMKDRFRQEFYPFAKKYFVDLYLPCMYFSLSQYVLMASIFSSNNPANFGAIKPGDLYALPFSGFKEYWFLAALFFVKVIHAFLECKVHKIWLISAFWLAVFLGVRYVPAPGFLELAAGRLSMGLYFHAGFLLKRYAQRYVLWQGAALWLAGMACYLGSFAAGAAMLTSLGVFAAFYALKIKPGVLVKCGVLSMVIYCLHNWITAVFRMAFKLSGLASSGEPAVLFAVSFCAAMTLPFLVVWLYKNVKALRWVEYIFYPGRMIKG